MKTLTKDNKYKKNMSNEKLKTFCTNIAMQVGISQGVEMFMEEIIQDADMLYNYIRNGVLPKKVSEIEE